MSSTADSQVKRSWGVWLFLAGQPLVLALFAAAGISGSREFQRVWRVPPLNENPLSIRPQHDCPDIVTDDQLRRALLRLRPRLAGSKTLLADVDHALRCWGPDAQFADPQFASGADLRGLLTDYRQFRKLYGSKEPSPLFDTEFGVCCRVKEGLATTSHTDHTLACLAEVGTPLSFPVYTTPTRQTTYRAMLEQSLHDFHLSQIEYEWSAKTFALFLPPTTRWPSTEGQTLSFDLLADRIMRERLPRGVCYGTHRLYGLMAYLRLDAETPILSPGMRNRISTFLKDANKALVAHQHADGFWNGDWPFAPPASVQPNEKAGDSLAARIIVTGHVVEYWALAPPQFQPKRAVVVAAARWILETIETLPDDQLRANFSFLSHAVRGLALWRGKEPYEALRSLSAEE